MTTTKRIPTEQRNTIITKGLRTVVLVTAAMSATLFLSAGTLIWPKAWAFIGFFVIYFIIWVSWGLRNDPELLMERAQAMEKENKGKSWDKILVRVNLLVSFFVYIVAGLDTRFQWSSMGISLQWIGFVLLILGYVLPQLALTNNPFASGIVRIQKDRGHKVSTGGPYKFIRHPMYLGSLLADFGAPLFFGSFWALIPGAVMAALFIYRTAREDQTLQEELPGYKEYAQKVRFRLVPGVW
jgi:protein-S-isoprenylcysteine O-methyltransferase Ste14